MLRVPAAFLLALLLIGTGPLGSYAGSAPQGCQEAYSALFPSRLLRRVYRAIGSLDTEVPYHVLNTEELLHDLAALPPVKARLIPFTKQNNRLEQLCLANYHACFLVMGKKPGGGGFVLKGADGRWFEAKASRSLLPGRYSVDFSSLRYLPTESHDLDGKRALLGRLFDKQGIGGMSRSSLTDYLAKDQLSSSTNAAASSGQALDRFRGGVREASDMLAELLLSGDDMRLAHLERLNRSVNEGIHPYGWKFNAPMAGVLRGTTSKRVIDGVPTLVDMSGFEVAQQWKLMGDFPVTRFNYFLPAAQVPTRMEALLARINKVNGSTPVSEVFSIYKEFVNVHPFADGNGRTSQMLLDYLLLRAKLPPSQVPSQSLFYRVEDIQRKYTNYYEARLGLPLTGGGKPESFDFKVMKSLELVGDMDTLRDAIRKTYGLSEASLKQIHGTHAYLFVGKYKGRVIQFESTHRGAGLSDTIDAMIGKAKHLIDEQASAAEALGKAAPTHAIYPELLEQAENYHVAYQENFLRAQFFTKHKRWPSESEAEELLARAQQRARDTARAASTAGSDQAYLEKILETPRWPDRVTSAEELSDRVMSITASQYQDKIRSAIVEKSSPEMKASLVEVYNAFNSPKFDSFMVEMARKALDLCRAAGRCGPLQRSAIPEKFLALAIQKEAGAFGTHLETVSRYAGREPGRLFVERIRRGALLIDEGAPGNHGLLPHALQNLFVYRQLGEQRAKAFFRDLSGWTYERMFDSNAAFTPIPSSRDITRRHYWSGVVSSGSRSEVAALGSLEAEKGRYSALLRRAGLELVEVEEKEKNLLSAGSVIRARYKGRELTFEADEHGVPVSGASGLVERFKASVDAQAAERAAPPP